MQILKEFKTINNNLNYISNLDITKLNTSNILDQYYNPIGYLQIIEYDITDNKIKIKSFLPNSGTFIKEENIEPSINGETIYNNRIEFIHQTNEQIYFKTDNNYILKLNPTTLQINPIIVKIPNLYKIETSLFLNNIVIINDLNQVVLYSLETLEELPVNSYISQNKYIITPYRIVQLTQNKVYIMYDIDLENNEIKYFEKEKIIDIYDNIFIYSKYQSRDIQYKDVNDSTLTVIDVNNILLPNEDYKTKTFQLNIDNNSNFNVLTKQGIYVFLNQLDVINNNYKYGLIDIYNLQLLGTVNILDTNNDGDLLRVIDIENYIVFIQENQVSVYSILQSETHTLQDDSITLDFIRFDNKLKRQYYYLDIQKVPEYLINKRLYKITVRNPNDYQLFKYQVKLKLKEDVNKFEIKDNFSIEQYEKDEETGELKEIPYWIEDIDRGIIWVKTNQISQGKTKDIYIRIQDKQLNTFGEPDKTFRVFIDYSTIKNNMELSTNDLYSLDELDLTDSRPIIQFDGLTQKDEQYIDLSKFTKMKNKFTLQMKMQLQETGENDEVSTNLRFSNQNNDILFELLFGKVQGIINGFVKSGTEMVTMEGDLNSETDENVQQEMNMSDQYKRFVDNILPDKFYNYTMNLVNKDKIDLIFSNDEQDKYVEKLNLKSFKNYPLNIQYIILQSQVPERILNTIEFYVGDTQNLEFRIEQSQDWIDVLTSGQFYFSVKKNYSDSNYVIEPLEQQGFDPSTRIVTVVVPKMVTDYLQQGEYVGELEFYNPVTSNVFTISQFKVIIKSSIINQY